MVIDVIAQSKRPAGRNDIPPALLIGLLFVVLMLLSLITLPPLTSSRADSLRSRLNQDVLALETTLTEIENDLQQMQAAVRGYVATSEPLFLEQYRAAQSNLPAHLAAAQELSPRVDPALVSQVEELRQTIDRWQREGGDRQLALVQQNRAPRAAAEVATGTSQAIFDSFRTRSDALQAQTQEIRADIQEQINAARTWQVGLTTGLGSLGLMAIAFVVFGFWQMVRLMRALALAHDQTERLANQARAERQRLQAVFDQSPEGLIFVEAPSGRIALMNPAAQALLGALVPGTPLRDHPLIERLARVNGTPCPPDALPLVCSVERGEEHQAVELVVAQPNGQKVPILLSSVPLRGEDGALWGAFALVQDLRRLREVERLKSDFVALVSHELRTPLTAIQGCAQSLLASDEAPVSDRGRSFVQLIAEQAERLQELIENLLSLSQVEAGALRLRCDVIPLPPLAQRVLRQLRDQLHLHRIQADIPSDLPDVSADPRRIEQVLTNLIDNARKFAPAGSTITVRVAQGEGEVCVRVCDQGPGIAVEERERVFERFYQVEQPTTRNVGGTGLGLAICKSIVEAHGGRIWIEDAPGGGTASCFTLPAPSGERRATSGPSLLTVPARDAPHVLVVDDDPALRKLLEGSLPVSGYTVQTVGEARAALEMISYQPPDVVLLDLMLPGTDGFVLCEQLREWTEVPIIMITARATERDVVLGLQVGADDYVTKPFRMNELTARIAAVLRRARGEHTPLEPSLIMVGQLAIDLVAREVRVAGEVVELTPIEYQLLVYLARNAGRVLTHAQILREVWGAGYEDENNYLWVHIAHLRQKIEANSRKPRYILTERGVGYRMVKG